MKRESSRRGCEWKEDEEVEGTVECDGEGRGMSRKTVEREGKMIV